ncbi:hypothetical protein [Paracoccus saliphilus]|nr:hypothetical protein [Paracoccus saliphilus]
MTKITAILVCLLLAGCMGEDDPVPTTVCDEPDPVTGVQSCG